MIDTVSIAKRVLDIIGQINESFRVKVIPSEKALSRVFEDVFWSSLDSYEGNSLRVRIFFAPNREVLGSNNIIWFKQRHSISQDKIRKLAPAQTSGGGLLVFEDENSDVYIEGMLGKSPSVNNSFPYWLSVESRANGVVRISDGHQPILEFTRGSLKQLGGMSFDRTTAEVLLMGMGLFPSEPVGLSWHISSAFLDIAFEIEEAGSGGAIWILPSGSPLASNLAGLGEQIDMHDEWWKPYKEMWESRLSTHVILNSGLIAQSQFQEFMFFVAQEWENLRRSSLIRSIASLAGIDGAIVMNGTPEVLAFGVICNKFPDPATEVRRSNDPSQPLKGEIVDASEFGGSRHRSAIDFCSSNHPAGALVASHDGGITVFVSLEKGRVIGTKISMIRSDAMVK